MKVTIGDIRRIVKESQVDETFMRGVPPFALSECVRKFVEDVQKNMKNFILADKSYTEDEQRNAIQQMNASLEELASETSALVDKKLFSFMHRV